MYKDWREMKVFKPSLIFRFFPCIYRGCLKYRGSIFHLYEKMANEIAKQEFLFVLPEYIYSNRILLNYKDTFLLIINSYLFLLFRSHYRFIIVELDMFIYFLSHMIRLWCAYFDCENMCYIRISDSGTLIIMFFLFFAIFSWMKNIR